MGIRSTILLFFLFPALCFANICELETPYTVQRREIPETPNYFFRALPGTDYVAYGTDSMNNKMVNLNSGHRFLIPGANDPVPTLDGKLMTTPNELSFYSVDDLLSGKSDEAKITQDTELGGIYQSIGSLDVKPVAQGLYQSVDARSVTTNGGLYDSVDTGTKTSNTSKIRVLTDQNGASYRDYSISYQNNSRPQVTPIGDVTTACQGRDIKLPMLSKDGRFLAARDMNLSPPTTRIFRLDGGGQCREIKDLGLETGKADFSFDGTKVAFHSSTTGESGTEYYGTHQNSDVFVYHLDNGSTEKLTNNKYNETSYFPTWRGNNELVYIDKDTDDTYSFVVANPDRPDNEPGLKLPPDPNCDPLRRDFLEAIGMTWSEICNKAEETNENDAVLTAMSLSHKNCRKMVSSYWENLSKKVNAVELGIGPGDLMAVCPKIRVAEIDPSTRQNREHHPPERVIQAKCTHCHTDLLEKLSEPGALSSAAGRAWGENIIQRINSNDDALRMPRDSGLLEEERQSLTRYIRGLMN